MEIFIVGAVVVALMVLVSTKIKQSAAQAFEPEFIEKDDFTINKPEGFMNPIDGNAEYAFEAYSRDFGEKNMRNVWQAHAKLTVSSDLDFESKRAEAKQSAGKILSERILKNDAGADVFLLESEGREQNFPAIVFRKIVESRARKKTYDLRIAVLEPFRETHIKRVNEMINSFQIK